MSSPARIASFGFTGLMVVCGTVCAVVISGEVGQLLAMVLIGLGLVLATALVFLEVGLSEDRQRDQERALEEVAREEQAREQRQRAPGLAPRSRRLRRRNLERSRGHRRRLS